MAKKLDIKKLAKDMSLQDKAKILFADRNKRAETSGLEKLLTPEEEDAIIKDAREHNQIDEINRLDELYKIANLLLLDIQTQYLNFAIAETKVVGFLGTIASTTLTDDIINKLVYDLVKDEKKREKTLKELKEKYFYNKGVFGHFGIFTPAFSDDPKKRVPNIHLQRTIIEAVERIKKFKEVRYQLDYVVDEVAGIDFLSDKQREDLKEYEKKLKNFTLLDNEFKILQIYKDFAEKKLFRTEVKEPSEIKEFIKKETRKTGLEHFTAGDLLKMFLEAVKDINKAVELTAEDKKKAREQIDGILNRRNI